MSQSRGKIAVFFEEFLFLKKVTSPRRVENVSVFRLSVHIATFSTVQSYGHSFRFYLFDKDGTLIGKSRMFRPDTIEDAMKRVGSEKVKYVVTLPSRSICYWLGVSLCNVSVYKMPKEGNLMELIQQARVEHLRRQQQYLLDDEDIARQQIREVDNEK